MKRIVLTEDRVYPQAIPDLAHEIGVEPYDLLTSLNTANDYLCKRLSIGSSLKLDRNKFSFNRVAGIFPVSEQLEIEVLPKFMTGDEAWRADFLLLLARTRWGVLIDRRMVGASKSIERSLSDSLAMVFLTMFEKVAHVPIRTYKRKVLRQFEIEGELDEESVLLPEKDGFAQSITEFTKRNEFNAVIVEAARVLSKSTCDFDLRARLGRAVHHLGPQGALPSSFRKNVPSRFRNWSELYGLCIDLLDGYGIDYVNQGEILAPGFVVRTSDAWEEFIRKALVLGMNGCTVSFQEKHPFAKRDNSVVRVRPDYVLRSKDGRKLLVDAKYKYGDARNKSVSNADIYEGWAFMEATGIPRLILLYPYAGSGMAAPFEQFQRVTDDNREIFGVRVNPEMIGYEGIEYFAEKLALFIEPMMVDFSR